MVRHRGKTGMGCPTSSAPPTSPVVHESTCRLPYEIVEIIIAYVARDLNTLKTCSLACRSWYAAAVAHIHHTLLLREMNPGVPGGELEPLPKLYELGLVDLVKEIRIRQWDHAWFLPRAFNSSNLRQFTAFSNVRTLRIHGLDIDRFMPNIGRYFGGLFQTLQSIALYCPTCTPQQLIFFISSFSGLDDIEIWRHPDPFLRRPNAIPPLLFAPPTQKQRGELKLQGFRGFESWEDLIASCRGVRFRYIELYRVGSYAPVLTEACAETLETFRFYLDCGPVGKSFGVGSIDSG